MAMGFLGDTIGIADWDGSLLPRQNEAVNPWLPMVGDIDGPYKKGGAHFGLPLFLRSTSDIQAPEAGFQTILPAS